MARFGGVPVEDPQAVPAAPVPRFGGVPAAPEQGPAMPSPDELRQMRLREIARAAVGSQGAGSMFKDAYTLGLQKPVSGLASALGGEVGEFLGGEPATFGERYQAGTKGYDDAMQQASDESGAAGTAASVAGSVLTGGPARNAAATAITSIPRMIGRATGLGAVEGAARGSDSLEDAAIGAAAGGAAAGTAAGALSGLTRIPGFRARRAATRAANRGPDPDEIRNQGRALFQQLDNSGTAFSQQQVGDLATTVGRGLRDANVSVRDMPIAEDFLSHQGPMTLTDLQRFRTAASDMSRSADDRERRMAGVMLRSIDDYVGRENPAQTQLPPGEVNRLWRQARQYWRTAALTDDLGWQADKATRRAARSNSGGNAENTLRQNMGQVVDRVTKPGAYNPYGEETTAAMERIAQGQGGTAHNMLRSFGNTFGGSGPLAGIGAGTLAGGAALSGLLDPTGATASALALYGSGRGARALSRNITENAADRLIGNVARNGAPALTPAQQAVLQGPPTRQRLALMQALGMMTRGAGLQAADMATSEN